MTAHQGTGADALYQQLEETLTERSRDPFDNPVRRSARDLGQALIAGRHDLEATVAPLVQRLTLEAFRYRARRLRAYLGECGPEANAEAFRSVVAAFAESSGSGRAGFEAFRRLVERELLGIVVTGHPTFGMSSDLTGVLARLATGIGRDGTSLDDGAVQALEETAQEQVHGRHQRLDLQAEHEFAQEAIGNVQQAMRRVYTTIVETAAAHYPECWRELVPRLMTVANWVGYDIDGRSDIPWYRTLHMRLSCAVVQLERYRASARELAEAVAGAEAEHSEVFQAVRTLETTMLTALETLRGDVEALAKIEADNRDSVVHAAERMATTRDTRLADPARLTALLDRVVEGAYDPEVGKRAAVLRAEIANFGLATAHVHVRLNASQVHNAVRKQVGMESTPDAPGVRRRVLRALDELLDRVEPVTVNFGSILGETMTARRLMMVVAKMLRYADSRTPVRFLIAECNDAFTVLAALYLAKLFGVEDRLDISPLFETEEALRHGHDMVRELLRDRHYRAYVEQRGRLCLQTGFSDSGRYMGQTAASLAIERLRVKLAKVLRDEFDLQDVDVVIFDTHGESIGRGAHPEGFAQRLEYAYPPFSRNRFACSDIPVKQELSFQGGDGYVFLATPEIAFATTCRLLEHALAIPHDACDIAARTRHGDQFYEDTEYSLEFFLTIKGFHDGLMDSPAYAALLNAYGPNLFFPTGSRKAKRQHDGAVRIEESHPSQMRAIPHNGTLQQMGFLATSASGVGTAIATDRDHFAEVYRQSPRLQQLIALVAHAWRLSDLSAFDAYTALFDPQFWLDMALAEADGAVREQFLRLSRFHSDTGRHQMLSQVQRTLMRDAVELETGLVNLGGARALTPEVMDGIDPTLRMLHTVRIALIIRLYDLAARIPRFSGQPDVTIEDVVNGLLSLDVESAVASLRRAFPRAPATENLEAFGEPATYRAEREQGYEQEHRELFEPMLQCHELIRRVSAAIAHIMGAVG